MDVERIEAALRAGPTDEPAYVAGAFRASPSSGSRWMAVGLAAAALVLVVVLGLSTVLLRTPAPGNEAPDLPVLTASDLAALKASLQGGRWGTADIARQEVLAAVHGHGFGDADISAYFKSNPIGTTAWYEMLFLDDVFSLQSADERGEYGGYSTRPKFILLPDGRLQWTQFGCTLTVGFTVSSDTSADTLVFAPVDANGCTAEEQIRAFLIYNLAPYARGREVPHLPPPTGPGPGSQ